MSGGTWVAQNKVRPGAYINFKSVKQTGIQVGSRGIVTLPMKLSWGEQGKLIDVYSEDLASGTSLNKVGLLVDDEKAKLLKLALSNAYLCKVYREKTTGAVAATGTIENFANITAKYTGAFGNEIVVIRKPLDEVGNTFEVTTYANGYEVDTQRITKAEELVDNDFVKFTVVSGEDEQKTQTVTTKLTNGADGTADEKSLDEYFNLLRINKWQTMANTDTTKNQKVVDFIKDCRENEGLYVQAVINDTTGENSDYEGIINNINGVVLDNIEYTAAEFTAYIAGATAGAEITVSNTGKVIEGATAIVGALDNNKIIEALQTGKLVLSLNQNGDVKIEKDINSYHSFVADKTYVFSKNRVIRTLDEIGSTIKNTWETTYLGKVSNNEDGRTMFKSSIIDYMTSLQNLGAIQDFSSEHVTVERGNDIDSVVATILVKPVDSMEYLYLDINVTD